MTATSKATPILHPERAEAVLNSLIPRYLEGRFPYNLPSARLPQEFLPAKLPRGGVEEAMFYMRLCTYMRGGIQSDTAAKLLAKLYVRRPQLFDPQWIVQAAEPRVAEGTEPTLLDRHRAQARLESSIRRSLVAVGLKYMQNIAPGYWIENDRRLVELYDGDPRKIFTGVDSYEEACKRVCNRSRWKWVKVENGPGRTTKVKVFTRRQGFLGCQEKMVSMKIYYLQDAGLIPELKAPPPVDFHLMRMAVETEMVTFPDLPDNRNVYSDELQAVLRQGFVEYSEASGFSLVVIANALWLFSSVMCSVHPGNKTWNSGYQARSTELTPHEPTWNLTERRQHYASCGSCPLAACCKWDIPNAQYTRRGELLLLRLRSLPSVFVAAA